MDEEDPSEELDFSSFVASFVKWPVACTHCGGELTNLEKYNVHMAAHKEGGPCVCLMCKMKFSCRDDFLLHKALCQIEGIFECTRCSKRFHTEKKLSEHLESHIREGVYCDICGLSFVSKDKLISHMKIHKTNIFVCGKCKQIFKCNSSFKNHTCISEDNEKKFYTFADIPEKKVNGLCRDSLSTNEESDSEDAETCRVVSESHLCKVCGDSFEQKELLIIHLATHFQCIECKKYFKSQTDLDMHTFLLADEKLYSCCLCETIVHGKKELEHHLSQHLASDDEPYDDLEWDDNSDVFQNVIPSLDATESLQSALLEKPVANVKIHKVIPAGNNVLKCSSCGKFVLSHHNLSAHIEPNTLLTDSDEEYVYISRLESPQNKPKQTEDTYCTCHYHLNILSSLSEQSPSKSHGEYECQEAENVINTSQISTHLHPLNSTLEDSVDSKPKSVHSKGIEDHSVVQFDDSNDKGSNCDRPNDFEILKPEMESSRKVLLHTNQLLNRDSTSSSASNISDLVAKKDCKNRSDGSKSVSLNTELEAKIEGIFPNKSTIRLIRLDKTDALPFKSGMKEFGMNTNIGDGNPLAKPVKILISTGSFSDSSINCGSVSDVLNGSNVKKSIPILKSSATKRSHPEVNIVNQEKLVLPSITGNDGGKNLVENPVSKLCKVKIEKSIKKRSPSKFKDDRTEFVATQSNENAVKLSNGKIMTLESKACSTRGEKRKNVSQQALNVSSAIDVMEPKHGRKPKSLGKTDTLMLRPNNEKVVPSKRRPNFMKKEQEKNKTRSDASTPNANGNENSNILGSNMIFKVEQLRYESEEEEEEESLDFSGIKKEFLASDVFIKEEEWDIVDF